MKIKTFICILMMLLLTSVPAGATQLPKEVKDYLIMQKKVPTVRFDGIIVYNENVMYIPVFPAYPETVETLAIKETYPKNLTMDQLPDMVLFNNNMGLLKVIRTNANTLTVRNIEDEQKVIQFLMWPQYILFRMERKIYNHVKHGMILPAIVFLYKKMPNES